MVVYDVNPSQGPVAGHTLVTITGDGLPDQATVYFGERTAEVVAAFGGTFIVVDTPPGEAGWVDVLVIDRVTDESVTLSNAFAYVDEGQEPPPTTWAPTTTTWAPVTTSPPLTTLPPTTLVPTTTAGGTSAPPTTTPIPEQDFRDWRDSLLITPEGLTLAPVPPDSPINRISLDVWVGALCDEPICPGWVLEQP